MRLLIFLFLFSQALAGEHTSWLNEAEKRLDQDAVAWLRNQIKPDQDGQDCQKTIDLLSDCSICYRGKPLDIESPKILIFISFSVPENIWLSLSEEMKNHQAVFVLRGLPDNSFKLLAQRIAYLKKKGMEASVQIHPNLFKEYEIQSVPTFVFTDADKIHKISGSVSLSYARDLISKRTLKPV